MNRTLIAPITGELIFIRGFNMYQTEIFKNGSNDIFDWETYFSTEYSSSIIGQMDTFGFLTRWLLSQYGGSGVLVDKSQASSRTYHRMQDNLKKYITYLNADLFHLELEEEFDLICSFGLIEHFVDKQAVFAAHKKFAASNANIIIIVPLDSPLTRAFLEVHPELNLGYRELLSEQEFKRILTRNALHVIRMNISQGYSYDFVGAVCYCP
jgi:SAM-dependent methyltransferase